MFGLGTTELLILLVIVIVLFGAKRLPKLARAVGESVRAMRNGSRESDIKQVSSGKETIS